MSRPNVILLTIDTLRIDRLGCFGRKPSITPNIDRLASNSLRFSQAITGGSWTQAAFPAIMTSTHASMYGGCLGVLSPDRPSPIESLAQQGYVCAAVSTSPWLSKTWHFDRGFNEFFDLEPGEVDPWLRGVKGGQWLLRKPFVHRLGRLAGRQTRPAKLYSDAAVVNQTALQWLSTVSQPFFLWLHYMDVHWPYHIEDELIDPQDIALAWHDLAEFFLVWRDCPQMDPAFRARLIALYERSLSYLDRQLGIFFDDLERMGFMDDTIIILTADHGEEFCEHSHWGHPEVNLFDEIVRVPLLIKLPGKSAELVDRQVRLLDLMPTILDLCDVEPPAGMLGTNLAPLWSGSPDDYHAPYAISERARDDGYMIAIRTERFKVIWDSRTDQKQVFDLWADPFETIDVCHENPGIIDEFMGEAEAVFILRCKTETDGTEAEPELDEAMIERLRGLGYLGEGGE